jgi:hypothetical protein
MTEDMELASLKLAYEADAMTSEVIGRTDLSFNSAYPRYLRMIGTLEHQGYTVEESRLKTQITESRFLLRLKRDLQ